MNYVKNTELINLLKHFGISIIQRDKRISISRNPCKKKSLSFKSMGKLFLSIYELFGKDNFLEFVDIPPCLLPQTVIAHFRFQDKKNVFFNKNRCFPCKFLGVCPGWAASPFDAKTSFFQRPVVDIPNEVVFELTEKCNQSCLFCNKNKATSISCKRIIQYMDECLQLGIKAVRFTGGEPLLYKNLIQLLKEAKKRRLYVLLNTNANDLTSEYLTGIGKYVDNVLVSLHGYDTATESFLSGVKIDFVKKIKNILMLKNNVPVVRVGTIISKIFRENAKSYQEVLAKILKMNFWELYRPMQTGNEIAQSWCFPEDIPPILSYLKNLHEMTGMDCKIANPIPFCIEKKPYLYKNCLLGAVADDGHSRMVLDAKGFFKPSYFINYSLGESLYESWKNPFLTKLRSLKYLPSSCLFCFYLPWCRGGSRSAAYSSEGNYFARDPWLKSAKN